MLVAHMFQFIRTQVADGILRLLDSQGPLISLGTSDLTCLEDAPESVDSAFSEPSSRRQVC